ncbi:CsbD family protein [Lignipirellula cremea]|uniref:CsbD-like domain-containing protein n=1 Tax=Lignipirellula cremea TaxID=2528010 RepID=A0A518DU77_9BACT|nr:CsbD family protein [Lignipirellula cremea]QDU95392.1 hypothetical protein Pla8534_32070 [Lignipirellula cremea]
MVSQETLLGRWSEIKGKLQERWGELTNDPGLQFEGDVNRLVGHIHVKTGETREQIESYLDELVNQGSDMASRAYNRVSEAAVTASKRSQEAADAVNQAVHDGYQQTEAVVRKHPMEALAVCFGVGLITGVVVGLATLGSGRR